MRDLEFRFGVTITVDAERRQPRRRELSRAGARRTGRGVSRAPEPELEHRHAGYGAPTDDEDIAVEETPEIDEEPEIAEAEPAEDEAEAGEAEVETEGARGEGEISAEENERRRRRRRRRRRGSPERPPGDMVAVDAPQPNDEGLAVVAEIGGDFSVQTNPAKARAPGRAAARAAVVRAAAVAASALARRRRKASASAARRGVRARERGFRPRDGPAGRSRGRAGAVDRQPELPYGTRRCRRNPRRQNPKQPLRRAPEAESTAVETPAEAEAAVSVVARNPNLSRPSPRRKRRLWRGRRARAAPAGGNAPARPSRT